MWRIIVVSLVAVFVATLLFCSFASADVIIHLPGYSATTFGEAASSGDDLAVDSNGRLYVPTLAGIMRFDPDGSSGLWSSAVGASLTLTSDGTGYLSRTGQGVLRISADGSFSPFPASVEWNNGATGPSGILYANLLDGSTVGFYSVNASTGETTQLVNGGPVPDGASYYDGMIYSRDGHLYTNGYDYNSGQVYYGIYRYDHGSFTQIAQVPHGGFGLTEDSNGYLYAATSYYGVPGDHLSEVWRVDAADGSAELLASGLGSPAGIAFDARTNRLYVRDQDAPYHITAITVPEPSAALPMAMGLIAVMLSGPSQWEIRPYVNSQHLLR
jgi:hypothetical protein